jgi:pSer/pThr/pTyr-binding forkhead associated (FHA) protein
MAKLVLTLDGAMLGEQDLDKELVTIGRRPNNDVHIDNLAVSGSHAVVRTIGNDSFLEDLDSTNGTMVNGKPIKKHILQHGDLIELGKYQIRYVNEAAVNAGAVGGVSADFEKTMIIRPSAMKAVAPAMANAESVAPSIQSTTTVQDIMQQGAPAATAAPKAEDPQVGHIQVLNGASAGREMALSKALTTLGKPGVQVAVITKRPHGYFITHVEGVTHPVVNGQSIGAQAHELKEHDVIELAGTKMEFFFSKG